MIPKYRAWIKPSKTMNKKLAGKILPVDGIEWDYEGKGYLVYVDVFDGKENWEIEAVNCELLQWTGLKDVDGVDIYEGAIVSFYTIIDADEQIGIVEFKEFYLEGSCGHAIKVRAVAVVYNSQISGGTIDSIFEVSNLKVIGSIQQNPELLEEAKTK